MTKEKKTKEPKSSKGLLLPFLVGMGVLFASWFYWPAVEALFIARYFKTFHSAIDPMFILALYLIALLLVIFAIARWLKRFSIFLGTFLPLAGYLGYQEWNAYHLTLKTIDADGLLSLLFTLFSKRT